MSPADGGADDGVGDEDREAGSGGEADGRYEREVHDLRVSIDLDLCVGFGDCVDAAPGAFALNGEELAELTAPEEVERETLLEACRSCPVDAIVARDEEGRELAP